MDDSASAQCFSLSGVGSGKSIHLLFTPLDRLSLLLSSPALQEILFNLVA